MKVELPSLGIQTQIQDYKINKKLDDFGVVIDIDTKAIFDKDNGYAVLLENTLQGNTNEPATITIPCGAEDVEIEGYIQHNEGKVNFNECRMEKAVKFDNPIECIVNKEINIFDYTPYETKTIQGEILYTYYNHAVLIDLEQSKSFTVDQLLGILGGYPDKTSLGFFPEFIDLQCYPNIEIDNDENSNYTGHNVTIYVKYIQIFSLTKYSDLWLPIDGGYYFSAIPALLYNSGLYTDTAYIDIIGFIIIVETGVRFTAGKLNTYVEIPISNTFQINQIIEDIFECTGLEVRSNFFDINADNTQPDNSEYDFAIEYCQNLRIAQSYDIIRESALEDSFGKSGTFMVKQMILEFNRLFGLILIYDSITDVMRWEHYTYFEGKGIDFELQGIEYEFSDDADINKDVVNTETWTMAQPSPTDGFYTTKIDYQNYSLNSEINDITKKSDKFMTDIFGCLNNKDYEGDEYKKLFFLMATDGSNVIALNSALSMRSIVENLHYRNRALKTGLHDNRPVTFSGYSVGLSAEISFFGSFKVFNKINPTNTVKLNVNGNGTWLIDEMEIEGKKITIKIKK